MFNAMIKARNKKGFTLMEMLIVIAIIAILIAIAIPVFSSQLDSARVGTDKANLRAAKSLAVSTYLLDNPENTAAVTYGMSVDGEGNLIATGGGAGAKIGKSSAVSDIALTVTVTSGAVTATTWDSKLA